MIATVPAGKRRALVLGLFFVSASLLSLEISLMRVLKLEGFGNFSYTAISLALLGFGASGALFGVFEKRLAGREAAVLLLSPAVLLLTLGTGFFLSEKVAFDPLRVPWDETQLARLLLRFSLYTSPFAAGAAYILVAFRIESPGRAYFVNLAGSAFGVLALLGALYLLPPERSFLVPAALALCAFVPAGLRAPRGLEIANGPPASPAGANGPGAGKAKLIAAALFSLAGLSLVAAGRISILPYKGRELALNLPDARVVYRRGDPLGVLEIVESGMLRFAPGLSLAFTGDLPEQSGLYLDGDRLAAIDRPRTGGGPDGDAPVVPGYLRFQIQFSAYLLHERPRVLIVGLGGGVPVERALCGNARDITVTEENPRLIRLARPGADGRSTGPPLVGPWGGGPRFVRGGVRGFLDRTGEKWEVIELPLADIEVSSIGGIYAGGPNYALTLEAFRDYLGHLEEGGTLSVSVPLQNPPRSVLKLVAMAKEALGDRRRDAGSCIVAMRSWSTGTVLIRNGPFEAREISALEDFCGGMFFDFIHRPGIRDGGTNRYNVLEEDYYAEYANAILKGEKTFYRAYLFDVKPPSDERPYFFSFFKLSKTPLLFREMGGKWLPVVEGGSIVISLTFAAVLLLSSLFIGVPYVFLRRSMGGSRFRTFAYFGLIAVSYMFIEVSLVERLARHLLSPVYSSSVVLASLLVFSGIGSYCSDYFVRNAKRAVACAALFVALYLAAFHLFSGRLYAGLAGAPLAATMLVTPFLLAPLAFAMGVPFPVALRGVRSRGGAALAWAWSVNGFFSVIASSGFALVAMHAGHRAVSAAAAVCYLAAAALFPD